ncbi:MAG: DUF3293 domain-containing protein [Zoogloeaceae bacterium]|nr:DUF3293 domain-containing protein [Zoogloeaceae bacterium]
MTRESLTAAYGATSYCVFAASGLIRLRVGETSAELAKLLAAQHAACFAVISAENPGSRQLPPEENRQRSAALQARLTAENFDFLPAENVADQAGWPVEISFMVLDCDREAATRLGRAFAQAAVLVGDARGCPRLLWLESE